MRNKITKIMAVVLCMGVILTGCSAKKRPDFTKDQAIERSTEYALSMRAGEFGDVYRACSEEIKGRLTEDSLAAGYRQVEELAGEFVRLNSVNAGEANGLINVLVILEYTGSGVGVSFTYDRRGVITGLWTNFAAVPQELADNELFYEEKIRIGECELEGVKTVPKTGENFPVVVFVQGSGASDYNETIGQNRPFQDIAWALAERGIASVRINKRYYQVPELSASDVTIYNEYMDDIYALIAYARAYLGDDVFLIGHSQGAMSGPKIAYDNNLKGLIMMRGTLRSLEDVIIDQSAEQLATSGRYSQKDIDGIMQVFYDSARQIKELDSADGDLILGISRGYWLSLKDLDREGYLKDKLDIPVLVMQGMSDFQVYWDKDYMPMKEALSDKDNIEFVAYPGLNHLFMPSTDAEDATEYFVPSHIPAYVTDRIADFILENK